jgi:hypothetical protein
MIHSMNEKDRLGIASQQLDRILAFFPRVEGKATFLFAFNTALLAAIALNLQRGDLSYWFIIAPAGLAMITQAISIYFVYYTFFPNLEGGQDSLLYFREIAKNREARYIEKLGNVSASALRRDFAAQIWRNSEILTKKFNTLKIAFLLAAISILPWLAFLVAVSLTHGTLPVWK